MITDSQNEKMKQYEKLDIESRRIRSRIKDGEMAGGDTSRVSRELSDRLSKVESQRNTLIDTIPKGGK